MTGDPLREKLELLKLVGEIALMSQHSDGESAYYTLGKLDSDRDLTPLRELMADVAINVMEVLKSDPLLQELLKKTGED